MPGFKMARIVTSLGLLLFCFLSASCNEREDLPFETYIEEIGDDSNLMEPDVIQLSFMAQPDERMYLNLTKNRNVRNDVPVFLETRDRHIEQWDQANRMQSRTHMYHAYYVNIEFQASVLMRASPRGNGTLLRKYNGWFSLHEKDFHFEPMEVTTFRGGRHKRSGANQRAAYAITKVAQKQTDSLLDAGREIREIPILGSGNQRLGYAIAQDNVDPMGQHQYYVELLFVLDYGTFRRMWNMGTQRNPRARREETIANLQYFYSHVANGIDLRYRTIDNEQYSINVRLAGMFIAQAPEQSPWTENIREYEDGWSNAFINAYTALDEFELWLNDSKNSLVTFDHAALVSSYQLFGNTRADGSHRRISGLSDIKGVCTYWRASINQDRGQYALTQTVAHELGHSLGAYHDGTQNTCTGKDQYIMASSPGVVTDENYLNLFTFSPCSISEFTKHLTFLNMMGMNCLANVVHNHVDPLEVEYHLRTPPGQLFNIDRQCQYIHNSVSSFYCGGANNDRDVCRVLECYHPDYKRCYSSVEQRSANGTSCGDKKWCMLGDCVEDQRAPSFLDHCWSGDYKGTFYDGRTCGEVVSDSKWLCYDEKYRDACCQGCEDVREKGDDTCPYGDKSEWCSDITRRDCYTERVQDVCCNKCQRYNSGLQDCQWGNRATWCENLRPSMCYNNEHTCCEKCHQFRLSSTNEPHCLYGDKASWCSTVTAAQCYNVEDTCCSTCKRFTTGLPGCKYGNKGSSCRGQDCSDPYWTNRCCYSCYEYLDVDAVLATSSTRSPPTTTTTTTRRPTTTSTTTTTPRPTTTTTRRTTTRRTTTRRTTPTTSLTTPRGGGGGGPVNHQCAADKAPWCRNIPTSRCYLDNEICCASCPALYTGITGCEFGDHASWCLVAFPGGCYSEKNQKICCGTCPELYNPSNPDCPWGDRYTWCSEILLQECVDPEKRKHCCKKCSIMYRGPRTTSPATTSTTSTTTTTRPAFRKNTTTTTATTTPSTTTSSEIVSSDGCVGPDASWCADIPASYCYSVLDSCCNTCKAFYKDSPQGCQFGDHFTWCQKLGRQQCSDEYYQHECCESCAQHTTTSTTTTPAPVCEDASTWCPSVHAGQCYSVADICCRSCALAQTHIRGCAYGDHYASCETLERRDCYFRSYRDSCCSTCEMLKSSEPACPWGDRYTDCTGADCTDPRIREYCCESCNQQDMRPVTTTLSPLSPECTDDATWCPTIPARDCYVSDHVCCRTCVKHYTGLPTCVYGDEVSWCSKQIETMDDCNKANVGPFCCLTCASISLRAGYGWIPEPDSEVNQGALIVLQDTTVDEMLEREPKLLELLSVFLDDYCSIDSQRCCQMALMDKRDPPLNSGRRRYRYFQKTHCHIGTGYPRKVNSQDVMTKILARIPLEFMDIMCVESTSRAKREIAAKSEIKYVDKNLIYELLTENKLVFEEQIRLEISRVSRVEEDGSEAIPGGEGGGGGGVNIGVIAGVAALATVLILVFIIVLALCCKKKTRKATKQGRQSIDRSTANLYQPNAFQYIAEQRENERLEAERELQRNRILEQLEEEKALQKTRAIENPMLNVQFASGSNPGTVEDSTGQLPSFSIQKPD